MGKLIYQPKGKAREYAPWACNLFNGCSNRCSYCYNRHGRGKALLGKDEPTPKGNRAIDDMLLLYEKELLLYKDRILADGKGLFFSFVSDPMLKETWFYYIGVMVRAMLANIPCVMLTKCVPNDKCMNFLATCKGIKVGFTLTGCDELEPGASTNHERIECIKYLAEHETKTWASIEPVISITQSFKMIQEAYCAGCREFKIGLLSGKKNYTPEEVEMFMLTVDMTYGGECEIYWKESVMKYISKIE